MCTHLIFLCKIFITVFHFLKTLWHRRFNGFGLAALIFIRKQYNVSHGFSIFVTNCIFHGVFIEKYLISHMSYFANIDICYLTVGILKFTSNGKKYAEIVGSKHLTLAC